MITKEQITDEMVGAVRAAVGLSSSGWDTVSAKTIIAAAINVFLKSAPQQRKDGVATATLTITDDGKDVSFTTTYSTPDESPWSMVDVLIHNACIYASRNFDRLHDSDDDDEF